MVAYPGETPSTGSVKRYSWAIGTKTAPSTPSVDIRGKRCWASRAEMSSSGSPNVFAQPAWRCSSSYRSRLEARRSDPTSCQEGSTPVSAASRRYSSTPYIIIFVSVTVERSWPTRPAEWNVEPDVSAARSTSTTSRQPSSARWYATLVPPTPPPMTTARACSVTRSVSRGVAQGAFEVGRRRVREQALEVLRGVRHEVHVESGDALLEHAPHGLPEVGHHAHERQASGPVGPWRTSVVCLQKLAVGLPVELVVDAEVAQVEERVAHARVFPVDDANAPPVVDEVRIQQVVVTRPQIERIGEQSELDPAGSGERQLVFHGDPHAAARRQRAVGLNDPEGGEQPRDRRTVVEPAD